MNADDFRIGVFVTIMAPTTCPVTSRKRSNGCINPRALEPVRQGVHRCFGSIAPDVACLGRSFAVLRARAPNGVAERFVRTLKENLLWARTFDTIEELRAALVEFARHYNETWLVARHGNRTPAQVRAAQSQLDQNANGRSKVA
jgi:hypothetical protein